MAIESSGGKGGVALRLADGKTLEIELEHGLTHGRALVPAMAELLRKAGISLRELDAVAVSAGPGSYTGLRVGITAAKTLAWAAQLKVVRVSTLEALALDASRMGDGSSASRLVPVTDAKRGEIYAAFFSKGRDSVLRDSPDEVFSPEGLRKRFRAGDFVFGSAVAVYRDEFATSGVQVSPEPSCPRAATIAELGARLLAEGICAPVHELAPEYLRRPEAVFKKRDDAS